MTHTPDVEAKREAPMSLRLPTDLRVQLEEFADKNGYPLHRVVVQMLREGFHHHTTLSGAGGKDAAGTESDPGEGRKPASETRDARVTIAEPAPESVEEDRAGDSAGGPPPRKSSSPARQTQGAQKGYCIHRIPLESFCAQCR